MNAVSHGVLAQTSVIPGVESEEEWQRFREAVVADLRPVGASQEEIVHEIAALMWRKRRVSRMELACFDAAIIAAEQAGLPHPELAAPTEAELQKVSRYEAHLTRDLQRCLRILKDLRAMDPAQPPVGEKSSPGKDARGHDSTPALNLLDIANTLIRDSETVIARSQAARTSTPRVTAAPPASFAAQNCETNAAPASNPAFLAPQRPLAQGPPETYLGETNDELALISSHPSRHPMPHCEAAPEVAARGNAIVDLKLGWGEPWPAFHVRRTSRSASDF